MCNKQNNISIQITSLAQDFCLLVTLTIRDREANTLDWDIINRLLVFITNCFSHTINAKIQSADVISFIHLSQLHKPKIKK